MHAHTVKHDGLDGHSLVLLLAVSVFTEQAITRSHTSGQRSSRFSTIPCSFGRGVGPSLDPPTPTRLKGVRFLPSTLWANDPADRRGRCLCGVRRFGPYQDRKDTTLRPPHLNHKQGIKHGSPQLHARAPRSVTQRRLGTDATMAVSRSQCNKVRGGGKAPNIVAAEGATTWREGARNRI